MARTLERVAERWGLLIVRDLLAGDQRFTDLLRSCGGITPRQLSARLRQLEEAGLVARDRQPGRREVWYRLTTAGQDLRAAVEALLLWGVEHASTPPRPDEPVRAAHVLNGTRVALDAAGHRPRRPVRWAWRFADEPHMLGFDGTRWKLWAGAGAEADVTVDTTPRAWAQLVMTPPEARRTGPSLRLAGSATSVREFAKTFDITVT